MHIHWHRDTTIRRQSKYWADPSLHCPIWLSFYFTLSDLDLIAVPIFTYNAKKTGWCNIIHYRKALPLQEGPNIDKLGNLVFPRSSLLCTIAASQSQPYTRMAANTRFGQKQTWLPLCHDLWIWFELSDSTCSFIMCPHYYMYWSLSIFMLK